MGNHALLSASSSHRWLNCPPSARLGENYEDKGSDFAAEGTDAHSLCEHKLKTALGIPSEDPTENLTWYNEEMEECASGYAAYVLELLTEAKKVTTDPIVLIEQRLDYSKYVESGFGTGDCVLIADGTLNIVDYKHGKGVEVSAEHNPQMMLYALGALEIFDALYDIDTVTMTIYQPRRSNVSTYTVSTAELLEWAETILKPTAELAFKGEGEFHCGEWCQFCKAKADCLERARANLALAAYDFAEPPLLTDEEIEEVLAKVDDLVSWANDIKEYALQAAISGKAWNGWKVVEGRSNRKYTDDRLVAAAVIAAGHDPYEQKLLGIPLTTVPTARSLSGSCSTSTMRALTSTRATLMTRTSLAPSAFPCRRVCSPTAIWKTSRHSLPPRVVLSRKLSESLTCHWKSRTRRYPSLGSRRLQSRTR